MFIQMVKSAAGLAEKGQDARRPPKPLPRRIGLYAAGSGRGGQRRRLALIRQTGFPQQVDKKTPASIMFFKVKKIWFVFCGLVLIMGWVLLSTMIRNSATADEGSFLEYGRQILRDHTARRFHPFHNSKMAVNALQALPGYLFGNLGGVFLGTATSPEIQAGRLVSVLFAVLLALYMFRWALEAFGPAGAFLSVGLLAFCPNILAHGNLLTTDVPSTCLIFISVYYFARLQEKPGARTFSQSAVATGLAQMTKFTALHLLPLFACFAIWRFARPWTRARISGFLARCLPYGIIVWVLINSGFLWEDMFRALKDFYPPDDPRVSKLFSKIPVPFPFGYFQGIVMSSHDDTPYPDWLYLLGHHSKERFALYFPLALLWKTPLGTLALFGLSLFCKPLTNRLPRPLILGTMLYFFAYFTFFHGHQIGVRFLLPLFPLAYLWIGQITQTRLWLRYAAFRIVCWTLFGFSILSSMSYYPHFIPYFNETIGNRLNAYRYLGDSNLDWNQANWYKEQYLLKHPDFHPLYNPTPQSKGMALLRASDVIGIQDPEKFRWLRQRHRPVGHIAHAWLIYDLIGDTRRNLNSL